MKNNQLTSTVCSGGPTWNPEKSFQMKINDSFKNSITNLERKRPTQLMTK